MTVAYLSPAWAEEAIKRVRSDAGVRDAMAKHKVAVLTIVENAPADRVKYLYASFDGQGNADLRVGMDPAEVADAPEPTFTIRGDYATFAAMRNGELTEKQAFMHRKLHVTGHKFKALTLAHPMQSLTHVLSQVPAVT